ncbi:DUF3427 domain-containing protein [Cellulomonas aerilata]|uniref:Helicase n=1 Tax=Cellulomonas aerilata TaxID=515326 RepID=A0A512DDP4_9CELL|nr:DEAD/DEAH box helicase [Cellulomonas aerilata]GEO34340.1 helicase [Cellulomonas aerilata]
MQDGLYESVVTARLRAALDELADREVTTERLDDTVAVQVLARHVGAALTRALVQTRDPQRRLDLANNVLTLVDETDELVDSPVEQLLRVSLAAAPGVHSYPVERPSTPLGDVALMTNAPQEPSLGAEIKAELGSADDVSLLCAFVKWYGLRLLEKELEARRARGVPLRVITSTYMGATEREALDRLVREFGAEVKVQYDIRRTRLHAKAWLFRRGSGFDTAYVGSSNLSRSAMLDGLEWNVRLSRVATPALTQKFEAVFDTYWNDPTYELYDPDTDAQRLDDALAEASGRTTSDRVNVSLSGLEVRPYQHQAEMLEALQVERGVHGRHRNLLVAATGTGKTVVAALDYKQLLAGRPPSALRLLFLAHRREILDQALRTYREVLADANFGELWVGGLVPSAWTHVFASVQALSARDVRSIAADAYDVVVFDEFHHADAPTYRRILDHLQPQELLGLTATPERSDGFDVRQLFEGRTAAELRLWDALEADLLVPFHYFGVSDGTDLSAIEWKRGRYDEAGLANLYTGNDARARIVLREVRDKFSDPHAMRALGFCVGVAHAEYMARVFTEAGLPARAVSGQTPAAERAQALRDLTSRMINVIFTADLYNEGVDLPDVDTVLFLRPTESATVFLQQLGRGLRHADDKAVLTALDFVGHQRKEFRLDARFRALTGATRGRLERDVQDGFPFLPSGSHIVLDRFTQQAVLAALRQQIGSRRARVIEELRAAGDVPLSRFLDESGLELADVVATTSRGDRGWARLRREAGLPVRDAGPRDDALRRRVRALAHVDDPERARRYRALLADDAPAYGDLTADQQTWARMLFFSLWPDGGAFSSYDDGFDALRAERAARDELDEVIRCALDNAEHLTRPAIGTSATNPLRVHARYQREEILAALDYASLERKPNSFREGVLFSEPWQADAFFVTLQKTETAYSPTTLYRDYAISPQLFHWESQSVTKEASPTGQRYIHHRERGTHVLLFSRATRHSDVGTAPYVFLGPATYVSHRGEQPIAFTWRLQHEMPASLFAEASAVAG